MYPIPPEVSFRNCIFFDEAYWIVSWIKHLNENARMFPKVVYCCLDVCRGQRRAPSYLRCNAHNDWDLEQCFMEKPFILSVIN
jgi:hypothetical protein